MELYDKVQEASAFLRTATNNFQPEYALILGTGLSNLAQEIEAQYSFSYSDIPHFPVSTVESHAGKLIFGYLQGKAIVAMAGRFHYYEGYSMPELTLPVRVFKMLEVKQLIISSAVGSINADMLAGDIVLIRDHINLMPDNPLRGRNDERLGPRFPDMLRAYDQKLIGKGLHLAKELDIRAHKGVYVAFPGPNLETPAEYLFLNRIGGDVVGMSTVPEVLVAKHIDLPVFVATVVANRAFPIEDIEEVSVEDVISTVQKSEAKLASLIRTLFFS